LHKQALDFFFELGCPQLRVLQLDLLDQVLLLVLKTEQNNCFAC
jgi:hypothetical protein